VTSVLAQRADKVNQLVTDGNQLFAALDERRAALSQLISGIDDVSQQLSGFVADNRTEFGPSLTKLNAVLDNLNERRDHISEALKRLPPYATALGEVVGSGPGFQVNVYGLPPPTITEVLLDSYFQPGKLPDSLADYLRGLISERLIIRPKSHDQPDHPQPGAAHRRHRRTGRGAGTRRLSAVARSQHPDHRRPLHLRRRGLSGR
jgi:phospholipid/cholesterol/gamma-HCH transport system substrate-binding protein